MTLQVDTSGLSYRVAQSWGDASGVNYGCTPLGWAVGVYTGVLERVSAPGIDCIRTHLWGGLYEIDTFGLGLGSVKF